MTLQVQVIDKGNTEPRTLPFGWGSWHLDIIAQALEADDPGRKKGWPESYTFLKGYTATDETDGEHFALNPGDTVKFWYS